MGKRTLFTTALVICFGNFVFCTDGQELVSNPTFEAAQTATVPTGWSVWGPEGEEAACRIRASAGGGFVVDGPDTYTVGGIFQDIKGIKGGQAYAVKSVCLFRDIPAPYHSLLVRVSWMRNGKLLHPAGMLDPGSVALECVWLVDQITSRGARPTAAATVLRSSYVPATFSPHRSNANQTILRPWCSSARHRCSPWGIGRIGWP